MRILTPCFHLLLVASVCVSLAACGNDSSKGPMEKTGEAVDKAAEKTGEVIKEGAQKTGEAAEKAGEKVHDAAK
ncbi:MAG: hypothetical protein H0W78_13645 [Planctomycetes bacterium]|nr:hypothetical protein [Planctomycetota bacterium]